MDAIMGWVLIAVSAVALSLTREEAVLGTTLAILAAGPVVAWAARDRVPGWMIGLSLSAISFMLPWPLTERMTLIFAVQCLLYVGSVSIRQVIAAASLMVVAGQSKLSPGFQLASLCWLAALMTWLALRQRELREKRAARRPWRSRDVILIGGQLAFTAAFGAGTAVGLPVFERWMVEKAVDLTSERQSGFGTHTDLNGVESVRTTSKIALRIHAKGSFYMRGQAYGTYHMGVWTSAREGTRKLDPLPADPGARVVQVTSVIPNNRIGFAPLATEGVDATTTMYADACGVATSHEPLVEWGFRLPPDGRRPRAAPLTAEERALYLQVTPEFEALVRPLYKPLQRPGATDRQKLGALVYMLNERCTYSLEPGAPRGEEPVARFLNKTRKGHCEYFASAMTLLGRLAGVPCRYVTGYAASECNPFGGYLMARDCDAHAWTEAYLPGEGWTEWDATPAVWTQDAKEQESALSKWLHELLDYLEERITTLWDRFVEAVLRPAGAWLARSGSVLARVAALVALLVLAWLGSGRWRSLLAWLIAFRERRRARADDDAPPERRAAINALTALEALLEPHGVHRGNATTPFELAARVDERLLPEPARNAARELIDLFCSFRYGGAPWDQARAEACIARLTEALRAR